MRGNGEEEGGVGDSPRRVRSLPLPPKDRKIALTHPNRGVAYSQHRHHYPPRPLRRRRRLSLSWPSSAVQKRCQFIPQRSVTPEKKE